MGKFLWISVWVNQYDNKVLMFSISAELYCASCTVKLRKKKSVCPVGHQIGSVCSIGIPVFGQFY